MLWRADSVSMVVRGTMHNINAKRLISLFCGVALMGSALFGSALPAMADQAPDKSGPGVARVSEISGSVVVQRGDDNKQVAAVVNAPYCRVTIFPPGRRRGLKYSSTAPRPFGLAATSKLASPTMIRTTGSFRLPTVRSSWASSMRARRFRSTRRRSVCDCKARATSAFPSGRTVRVG